MKKVWKVDSRTTEFGSFDEALKSAKRLAAVPNSIRDGYGIYELVSFVQPKLPEVDVITVT